MAVDDFTDVYEDAGKPKVKRFVRECRDCDHTIENRLPQPDPGGDRWVRCVCGTINRILPRHHHAEAEEA